MKTVSIRVNKMGYGKIQRHFVPFSASRRMHTEDGRHVNIIVTTIGYREYIIRVSPRRRRGNYKHFTIKAHQKWNGRMYLHASITGRHVSNQPFDGDANKKGVTTLLGKLKDWIWIQDLTKEEKKAVIRKVSEVVGIVRRSLP